MKHRTVEPQDKPRRRETPWMSILGNTLLHGFLLAVLVLAGLQVIAQVKAKQQEVARKRAEVERVQREIAVLQERNQQLKYNVQYLKTDDGIEKIAREKLDLVKPGEVTFQVIPPPALPHARAAATPTPAPTPQGWMDRLINRL